MAADTGPAAPPAPIALWRQLQLASQWVRGVHEGRSLGPLMDQADPALRPGAQALAFHALRWAGTAQALRQHLAPRRPPPAANALLCTALALLLLPGHAPYTGFTLVNQAVEAAKRHPATRAQAGLINACLRALLRGGAALVRQVQQADPVARWNLPLWWIERLQADHPEHWPAIAQAAQAHPPMVLRVNTARISVADYLAQLQQRGLAAQDLGAAAIRLQRPRPVQQLPGFEEGWFAVQSAAAQQAAPLLLQGMGAAPRLLDACAAPGGKTAHLLALAPQARVLALDVDAQRCQRITDNLARLGLSAPGSDHMQVQVQTADAARPDQWWDGQAFDAILLDAPCSASGIVHRHPDVRWLRRPADLPQLARQQDALLHALWPLLAPGGRLLYATCSVFREEGVERMQAFAAQHPDVVSLPAPGHILPGAPLDGPMPELGDNSPCDDGFFYALVHKRAA